MNMNRFKFFFTLIICLVLTAKSGWGQSGERYPIIPKPLSLVEKKGEFIFNRETKVLIKSNDEQVRKAVSFLVDLMEPSVGFKMGTTQNQSKNVLVFSLDPSIKNDEGYYLSISDKVITFKGKTAAGVFRAIQTLRQLMPPQVEQKQQVASVKWSVPCAVIEDEPRFEYRGAHLDVCRHFFPPEFIKRYIDLLALFKYNTFHWHLTEDQGWRIEIKKYPKLSTLGQWRKETCVGRHTSRTPVMERVYDNTPYQGFYTQEEIKEVVKYAQDRFINIIPEIEMPGHALAALAAYPELGCTQGPYEVATRWGVFKDVFCTRDSTFIFLQDVLSEVMELFPGKYIHIGGDECPKLRWQNCYHCQTLMKEKGIKDEHALQSYFIQRIEKFINSKGRQIIGWDEILEGGLAPNATVMSWRGTEGGIAAAKQHHDVIMTPGDICYFDYYQADPKDEPMAIGKTPTTVEKVYSYEPVPAELSEKEAKYIKGAQANVWSEYMKTGSHVEYMVFPRAIALAEVTWTPKEKKNYDDFIERFRTQALRLDQMKVNYAKHVLVDSVSSND